MLRLDLHRHYGGCQSVEFVWEAIRDNGWTNLAETPDEVRNQMQFKHGEPREFLRFLQKFTILDNIIWSEELIDKSVQDVCKGIKAERLDYTWLRFSINKYMRDLKWSKSQAIKFIKDRCDEYLPGVVGLIIALKYESDRTTQTELANLIDDPTVHDSVVGIDLVGDEQCFDYQFYQPLIAQWVKSGKIVCAHVGESQARENIRSAIAMGVSQIAHGVKAIEEPDLIRYANDCGVGFDMAVTSNLLTGLYKDLSEHPLRGFLDLGACVTIGTDDPTQCNTTLDNEFQQLVLEGYNERELQTLRNNAESRYWKYKCCT